LLDQQHALPSPAWYHGSRVDFLATPTDAIADQLAGRAAQESLEIQLEQSEEWRRSVDILHRNLNERIPILQKALASPDCTSIHDVILEFDFRRRGLRMDCLLLADGALFVVEFKRARFERAHRDQVMTYAVNLLEFHKVTQTWSVDGRSLVVPVLVQTTGTAARPAWPGLAGHNWPMLCRRPVECDADSLGSGISLALSRRLSETSVSRAEWLASPFRPSSSILDATLSLYGNHDVAAIQEHSAPKEAIDASTTEIRERLEEALRSGAYQVIFLSGAPGAGKTLVGLDLVMRGSYAGEAVFVSGNSPLVQVLNAALSSSYRRQGRQAASWTPTGYHRKDAPLIASAATYKIVKAHDFLGRRGQAHRQEDGRVLVFDEAQRTYEKGRVVLREKLSDHEADLILSAQRKAFPSGGAVVVALVGHKQAINRGERGIVAWLEAADRHDWTFAISDETLALAELEDKGVWADHPKRSGLQHGHLRHSMRFYRNAAMEEWAGAVLDGDAVEARRLAQTLRAEGNPIQLTRRLEDARRWARAQGNGVHRAGLIASGQARRLAAEGLFVDHKPDIASWMLAPNGDIRSSNALETVQNQYQIQGLELDYTIVCWDADLRREGSRWVAYKLSGADWKKDSLVDVAKNGYRVLLTRARKGMVIFVPHGDPTGEDTTRSVAFYDGVWEFLKACGGTESHGR
jgi:hypothetical protein